jgi:hypothetical protein
MHQFFFTFYCLFALVCSVACDNKSLGNRDDAHQNHLLSASEVDERIKKSAPSLGISDYVTFLKQLKGVTYDEDDNNRFSINVLYKPQALDAALSMQDDDTTAQQYQNLLEQKKGYYHVLISYHDKNVSLTKANDKDSIAEALRTRILVIKNQHDTVSQCIQERFPALVMGQPHQLMVLVPKNDTDQRLRVMIQAGEFSDRPLSIDITDQQQQKFPALKL